MEYEFVHDATTGEARAIFSLEHEVIGPWMEVELGNDVNKLTELLTAIDTVTSQPAKEITITGSEYSITLNADDIAIQTNASMNGTLNDDAESLPDMLTDEHINLDQNELAGCGVEDFRAMLLSWGRFTNGIR